VRPSITGQVGGAIARADIAADEPDAVADAV